MLVLEKENYLCLNVIFSKVVFRFTEKNTILQVFLVGFNNINAVELQKKIFFFENMSFLKKFGEPPDKFIYCQYCLT